jgi:hypothetical protein
MTFVDLLAAEFINIIRFFPYYTLDDFPSIMRWFKLGRCPLVFTICCPPNYKFMCTVQSSIPSWVDIHKDLQSFVQHSFSIANNHDVQCLNFSACVPLQSLQLHKLFSHQLQQSDSLVSFPLYKINETMEVIPRRAFVPCYKHESIPDSHFTMLEYKLEVFLKIVTSNNFRYSGSHR